MKNFAPKKFVNWCHWTILKIFISFPVEKYSKYNDQWTWKKSSTKNCDLEEKVQLSSDNYVFLVIEEMQSNSVQKAL